MRELMRWESEEGPVVVEVDSRDVGYKSVSRRDEDGVREVEGRFESALGNVRGAAMSALRTFRDHALDPDGIELEFGVKLSAAAGAVIAKTTAEGHLTVKLTWSKESKEPKQSNEAVRGRADGDVQGG
ncbi:CU044_2847 family protein [Streptomyces lasiicapitis]|uniref:CU044_2847 family protein n=1 Tax=Streptomyces lasiicapitis TaxID=1923961 RepID=UPI003677BF71